MTVREIIDEHLEPLWWLQQQPESHLQVLIDRLMEEKSCGMREAVWLFIFDAERRLAETGYLKTESYGISHRQKTRSCVHEGNLSDAIIKVRQVEGCQWWEPHLRSMEALVRSLELDTCAVPC